MASYAVQWSPREVDIERGWEYPAAHPEFSFFPATGQLSSFNPNSQNAMSLSKYGPLAHEFRDAIEASPGYVIAELDLKSFHAQTLGYEAGCPDYIRLAKLDVHSFVAGNMLKLPYFDQCIEWDDKELLDFLKWHRKNYVCPDGTTFQKVRDERAKVGVLAFGLGQSPNTLFEANRDSFLPDWFIQCDQRGMVTDKETRCADREGIKAAQLVHDTLNDRFPELKAYRENTPLLARQRDYLISRYGCIRWFWDILHWDARRREMVHGDDFDKAIAFPVQNDGHGYLKYALLRMEAAGMLERYGFINCIHDSVVFHCSERLLDEACVNVKAELERPSDVLTFPDGTGLSVQCEIKAGKTWGVMEEIAI
jgi:DNA polymerase I-like protein with 3'-5' exonuclease and polymerase domains